MKEIAFLIIMLAILGSAFSLENNLQVTVEIPEEYGKVPRGENVLVSIKITNPNNENREDIILNYWVEDEKSNKLIEKSETVAIEKQAEFIRNLYIPKNTDPGDYSLLVRATLFNGETAITGQVFNVERNVNLSDNYDKIILLFLLPLLFLLFKANREKIDFFIEKQRIRKNIKKYHKGEKNL